MLKISLLIGIYSYVVLLLGLSNSLNFQSVFISTLLFISISFLLSIHGIKKFVREKIQFEKEEVFLIALLGILAAVNLVGALGPELAFDALWYHLTIPKLYVLNHKIYFIHGDLLYYNLMPRLSEMLYASTLTLSNEIVAKVTHYAFGILSILALYKLARFYLSRTRAIIVVLLFYSNLVVSWLSITAYSDLPRAFFEILALYYFHLHTKEKKNKYLVASAILLGLATSTKILSLGSLLIFILLIFSLKNSTKDKIKKTAFFIAIALIVPLPWFVLSFFYSGNPFFPLFSHLGLRNFSINLLSPFVFIKTFVDTFLFSSDPINPIYLISFPLVFVLVLKKFRKYKLLFVYTIIAYLIWYATSQSGGARFLTSYLPSCTLLTVIAIFHVKNRWIRRIAVTGILLVAFSTVIFRGVANGKYLPVILGFQTKQDFLMKNLNFAFGDFYDENAEIKRIVKNRTVELVNMHNLYYVDFPFTLSEFEDGLKPSYVLVQNGDVPQDRTKKPPIYENTKTHVKLYSL